MLNSGTREVSTMPCSSTLVVNVLGRLVAQLAQNRGIVELHVIHIQIIAQLGRDLLLHVDHPLQVGRDKLHVRLEGMHGQHALALGVHDDVVAHLAGHEARVVLGLVERVGTQDEAEEIELLGDGAVLHDPHRLEVQARLRQAQALERLTVFRA